MERMDRLVLERLFDRVLDTERVTACLKDYLRTQAQSMPSIDTKVGELNRALKAADDALNNLYRGIELGIVPLDSTLQARIARLREEREQLLAEVVSVKREKPSARNVSPKQVEYACARIRDMLVDPTLG